MVSTEEYITACLKGSGYIRSISDGFSELGKVQRIDFLYQAVLVAAKTECEDKLLTEVLQLQDRSGLCANDFRSVISSVGVLRHLEVLAISLCLREQTTLYATMNGEYERHKKIIVPRNYKKRFLKNFRTIHAYARSNHTTDKIYNTLDQLGLNNESIHSNPSPEYSIAIQLLGILEECTYPEGA